MAKEADLKKIELKVSVNCCDGCKRKVKKVLQSVEGVLKTEVDPFQPKVTVLGDVDPQILTKRLIKIGKQAEVMSNVNPNVGKEKKEAETLRIQDKEEKWNPEREQAKKSSDSCGNATDKSKRSKKAEDGCEERAHDKDKNNGAACNANSNDPEGVKFCENAVLEASNYPKYGSTFQDFSNISKTGNQQYGYEVKPYAIAVPIYAMPSFPPTSSHDRTVLFQPAYQASSAAAARVGDYFSDDNTIGCHVM